MPVVATGSEEERVNETFQFPTSLLLKDCGTGGGGRLTILGGSGNMKHKGQLKRCLLRELG